jgi:phosphatidylserine/phosphatidylglycerophosphate/cardiolipin synthase-like enzyme
LAIAEHPAKKGHAHAAATVNIKTDRFFAHIAVRLATLRPNLQANLLSAPLSFGTRLTEEQPHPMRIPASLLLFVAALPIQQLQAEPRSLLDRLFSRPPVPGTTASAASRQTASPPGVIPLPEVYFSPKGGCTQAVVREMRHARQSILVQAYSFTSAPIAAALVEAARRGVLIEVVLDKSNKTGRYSAADFVAHAGIPTWLDEKHAIAHNKVMIIDGTTVITGSFNFTKAAEESNAENLLIIRSEDLASLYSKQFIEHRNHSSPYSGR